MRAGKTKTPPAVGPVVRPRDILRHALARADILVAAVRVVGTLARAFGRHGAEERRDMAVLKTHVIIPFIVNFEGLDAARDRMFGDLLEVRLPRWIDRPKRLKIAADPVQKFRAAFLGRNFDSV